MNAIIGAASRSNVGKIGAVKSRLVRSDALAVIGAVEKPCLRECRVRVICVALPF
jgi:hypothetical protein